MPLKKGNTNIGAIYKGTTQIAKIYKGTKLLFENAKWLDYLFEHIYHSLIPTTISGKSVQDKAKLTKISGNGVVENQLVQNGNFEDASGWNITNADNIAYSNNTLSLTNNSTSSAVGIQRNTSINVISGRKYLVIFKYNFDSNISGNLVVALNGFSVSASDFTCDSKWHTFSKVLSALSNDPYVFYIRPTASTGNTIQLQDYQLTDLTLREGTGNEPTDITDNRIQALLNRGYITYNTGSYKNSRVGEIETFNTNSQLLDTITLPGLLDLDGAINSHDTFEITNTDYVFTRNVGVVDLDSLSFGDVGNNVYYATLSTAKSNTGQGNMPNIVCNKYTTINAISGSAWSSETRDKVISLGYDTARVYLRDTSISQASDIVGTFAYELATPQVITIPKKHLGCVDLGSLNWTYNNTSGHERFVVTNVIDNPNTSNSTIANIFCNKYIADTIDHTYTHSQDKIIATANGTIQVYDSSYTSADDFKSAMAGQYLFYETDAEVSDFDNIAQINAGGSITSNSEVLPNVNFEIKCK